MSYTLNAVDIKTWGLYPARAENSNVAIAGCWDFPARIGKSYYDWGENNGIEPYLEPGQIFFGGRTITLYVSLLATTRQDATTKITNMYRAIDAFTGLVSLASPYGTFNVYVNDAISVSYIRNGKAIVKLSFREPVPDLSSAGNYFGTETGGVIGTESGGDFATENSVSSYTNTNSLTGIDGISFPNLRIMPLSFAGVLNRPALKPMNYKAYENEGYQIVKRKERSTPLKCLIKASNYNDFISVITGLYGLFQQANEHTLTYFNDSTRTFFVKDGFTVTNVNIQANQVIAVININITETGALKPLVLLADDGQPIITDLGFDLAGTDVYQTEF